jgi:hypothetical protein
MPAEPDEDFENYFELAKFTDEEANKSVKNIGIIASVFCKRIEPENNFVLAFATKDGTRLGPFVMTLGVASILRKALSDSGL